MGRPKVGEFARRQMLLDRIKAKHGQLLGQMLLDRIKAKHGQLLRLRYEGLTGEESYYYTKLTYHIHILEGTYERLMGYFGTSSEYKEVKVRFKYWHKENRKLKILGEL